MTVDAYLFALDARPSRMAEVWSAVGGRASGALVQERQEQHAALPDFTARLDGAGTRAVETVGPEVPRPRTAQVEIPRGLKPSPLPAPTPTSAPRVTSNTSASQELTRAVGQDAESLRAGGLQLLGTLQTSLPELPTSPGLAPTIPLTEGADPLRAVDAEQRGLQAAEKARLDAGLALVKGPGPAQVQPTVMQEARRVALSPSVAMPGLEPVPEMVQVAAWNLDADATAILDAQARPRMAESVARVREQLEAAEIRHHAGREAAVASTQRKVDAVNAEADARQAHAVGEARDGILQQQRETLRQQQEAVAGLTRDAVAQRTEALSQVVARVDSDERKISLGYQQAEKDAQVVQRQGEARARQEWEKAGHEAGEDESWWERPLELIKEALGAIARAIDGILSEVREAVGALLDRAKQAALVLIEETRAWVNDRLDRFGAWFEQAVTAVLGERFPELARELTAFIHRRIEDARKAVEAIVGGLKKTVSALVAGLGQTLDTVFEGYRAAVEAASVLAQALVSGDWSEAARMLLDGILRQLGIEPAEFHAFTGKLGSSLELIVDEPGAFVGNLVGAVEKGFGQFSDNILEHLKGGLLQWLFGVVAEAGITLPARFDVAGVFDVVLQVLGLTLSGLRTRAARLIGEENVERLELVWNFLTEAVVGGLGGLWEQAQEFLGGFWDMVVGSAQEWLVTTLVKKAFVKLASLFNPAGAIVQLILTAWDVFQWLRDNARRIAELVQAVTDSLGEIALGSIGKAANWIEQALAKMVPMAIHLLGNILGLGGIGEKVRELITRAREAIEQAIDKLLFKVLGLFQGRVAEEAQGSAEQKDPIAERPWWKLRDEFSSPSGHKHSLYFEGKGAAARLVLASTPISIRRWVEKRKKAEPSPTEAERKAMDAALSICEELGNFTKKLPNTADKKASERIDQLLAKLQEQVIAAGLDTEGLPPTKVVYERDGHRAGTVTAEPLTKISGNTVGSRPDGDIPGWEHVRRIDNALLNKATKLYGPKYWVRVHLLSHQLHGPGVSWNLVPGEKSLNTGFMLGIETQAKEAIAQGKVLFYSVDVDYFEGDTLQNFPRSLTLTWGALKKVGTRYSRERARRQSTTLDPPPLIAGGEPLAVNLRTASRRELLRLGLNSGLAWKIIKEKARGGSFQDEQDFKLRMQRTYKDKDFEKDWDKVAKLIETKQARF